MIIHSLYFMALKTQYYLLITLFLISHDAQLSATTIAIAQIILVLDDDLGLSKNVNPCILVPAANSRSTFNTTISN